MILIFPVDEETEACIAWGKIRMPRTFSSSPVTVQTFENGTEKFQFNMNVQSKKISNGRGKKPTWQFEDANVVIWAKPEDVLTRKMADCVKLLRRGDPVLVFGRHFSREWTGKDGVVHSGHEISADMVIPSAWLYDVLLALFAQIIAKAEPPASRTAARQNAPAPARKDRQPTIAHVNVLDDEDWRRFE